MPQILDSQFRITGKDETKTATTTAAANLQNVAKAAEAAAKQSEAASNQAAKTAEANARRMAGAGAADTNRARMAADAEQRAQIRREENLKRVNAVLQATGKTQVTGQYAAAVKNLIGDTELVAPAVEKAVKSTAQGAAQQTKTMQTTAATASEFVTRSIRQMERQFMASGGQLNVAQRGMIAAASGLAAYTASTVVTGLAHAGQRMFTSFADWENGVQNIAARTGRSFDDIEKTIEGTANKYSLNTRKVMADLQAIIASGARPESVFAMFDDLARASLVTGQSIENVWKAFEGAKRSFPTVEPKRAFDIIIAGAREGNIGLDQMAQHLPQLGQIYTRFGNTGEKGLRLLVAQMALIASGSNNTQEALQGLVGFLERATSGGDDAAFSQFGVRLGWELEEAKKKGRDLGSTLLELTRFAVKFGEERRHMDAQAVLSKLFPDDATRQAMLTFMQMTDREFMQLLTHLKEFNGIRTDEVQGRLISATAAVNQLSNAWDKMGREIGRLMHVAGVTTFLKGLGDEAERVAGWIEKVSGFIEKMEKKVPKMPDLGLPHLRTAEEQAEKWSETWKNLQGAWENVGNIWDKINGAKPGALQMERPTPPPLPPAPPAQTSAVTAPAPQRTAPATSGPDAPGSASERTQRSVLDTLKTMLVRGVMVAGRAVDSTYSDGSGLPASAGAGGGAGGPITPMGGRGLRGGTTGRANVRYGGQGAVRAGGGQGPGAGGLGRTPGVGGELARGQGAALLDAISRAEGTRGYNDSFAHQVREELTGKTLNEIDQIQAGMSKSSAIGRYQFMRRTLHGLRRELGLSGEEKFTPELQDRLGRRLLQRRGYDKFMRGEMTRDQFMKNVSTEWAGVTDAAGVSTHAGVGYNRQTASTVGAIDAAIARDRAGYRGPEATPAAQPGVPLAGGEPHITSPFGMRTHPVLGGRRLHGGTDYRAAAGSPVLATGAGTVTGIDRMGDVTIRHADGTSSVYRHVDAAVERGQEVAAGQRIASIRAHDPRITGPHLHYERRDAQGNRYDPSGEVSAAARGRDRPVARDPDRAARDAPHAEAKPITVPVHFAYHGMGEVNQRGRSQARREFNREVADTRHRSYSDVGVA